MPVKFVVAHRTDHNNVGDISSNPLQYFLKEDEYVTIDILDLYKNDYPGDVPLIVGGGGLFGNEFFGEAVRDVLNSSDKNQLLNLWSMRWNLKNPVNASLNKDFSNEYLTLIKKYIDKVEKDKSPRIIWGAGHNGEFSRKTRSTVNYPHWTAEFDLIGIRDWSQFYNWVPCASCMHPALRKKYAIKNDVIWFEHKKQLMKDFGDDSIPRFINSGSNVDQTIELLGSANVIITNSYHGAYWGTLLGKKVIVANAWSTKFQHMKDMPYLLDKNEDWKNVLDKVETYKDSLDVATGVTEAYWQQVRQLA